MGELQYLETRYYDSGAVEAHLTACRPVTDPDDHTGKYDHYVEEIGEDAADYNSLEDWMEQLCIELDDKMALVIDLKNRKWVDITAYC